MPKSRVLIALAAIAIIVVIVFSVYAGATYPKDIITIPVSFRIGADNSSNEFTQSSLNNKVQVTVSVTNGAALWRARILNGDQVIWEHSASQGEQTSYSSGWMDLPSGQYNFTFGIIGAGSLDATVTLSSKGGFW